MSIKKNNPQSGATGRYVSKEAAAKDLEGTFVTETTVSKKKYKECEALFKKLQEPKISNLENAQYRKGMYDTLNWLLHKGKKPSVK